MKLTTKMRYGTRALLELALNDGEAPISLKEIAGRQCVSPKYLEQLLAALQSAGLVTASRGARGGYALARSPAQINLRQIYDILEGGEGFVDCTGNPESCDRSATCVTKQIWSEMHQASMAVLEKTTLAHLAQQARQKQRAPLMYYI